MKQCVVDLVRLRTFGDIAGKAIFQLKGPWLGTMVGQDVQREPPSAGATPLYRHEWHESFYDICHKGLVCCLMW